MQFVVDAEHAPELCPTSNQKIRELMNRSAKEIPALAEKLGIEIIALNVLGPDHQVIGVFEAADIDAVREFLMESRLVQWNTTSVRASWSMEEALRRADALPTMF
jgi:uncharacterized protein with GYD domain